MHGEPEGIMARMTEGRTPISGSSRLRHGRRFSNPHRETRSIPPHLRPNTPRIWSVRTRSWWNLPPIGRTKPCGFRANLARIRSSCCGLGRCGLDSGAHRAASQELAQMSLPFSNGDGQTPHIWTLTTTSTTTTTTKTTATISKTTVTTTTARPWTTTDMTTATTTRPTT